VVGGWISKDHSKEGSRLFRGRQAVAETDKEVDEPRMALQLRDGLMSCLLDTLSYANNAFKRKKSKRIPGKER
jgi:hypothetical protein